ncbi:hypothetical protein KP509_29G084800 [Ceratopteris richardii]|nr:hypothetical protein KP509_29G084800 [Ceratopteris richardii]
MDRDKMLLELEQECLQVYKRKVDEAANSRNFLHQALLDTETEISSIATALGESSSLLLNNKQGRTLRDQLMTLQPILEDLRNRKQSRLQQFAQVREQIQAILMEMSGSAEISNVANFTASPEDNLSQTRLEEYHLHLRALQKEKEDRLCRVSELITLTHELCAVLAMDSVRTLSGINPRLSTHLGENYGIISDSTLDQLKLSIESLQNEKADRLNKLQQLGGHLIELWSLLDSEDEERERYNHIVNLIGVSESDITERDALSLEYVQQGETEVMRLEKLKVARVKELVVRKYSELKKILSDAHMEPDPDESYGKIMSMIDSGSFDASELLESLDQEIAAAKEEAASRKEIMEKMDKWIAACDEEAWLEEYNRDENRYNASRGAHINLKRAEKARTMIQKLPSMIESLIQKTTTWEEENKKNFLYDGVRLLDLLEEQNTIRKEKEQEKRKSRDQRKLQEHIVTEQEALFGPRPSPHRPGSVKKGLSVRANPNVTTPNRHPSLGVAFQQHETVKKNGITPSRMNKDVKDKTRPTAPVNYVAMSKEDAVAF